MYNIEDYREYYNQYFKEFNRLAVGEYADLSYGIDTPNGTSSSLESIIAYSNYINDDSPILLNAGAGASSWMFRKLFQKVTCIDPNEHYLNFIKYIFDENKLKYWYGFQSNFYFSHKFEHVFYDYGSIERLPFLGCAIPLATKSIYVDDSDCRDECMPYRNHVIDLCKSMGLKWFDCKESLDVHGRAGIIIEK